MRRATADPLPSFAEWADGCVPSLLRFAYLVCGSRSEAEDALQTALERACARWARVSRTENPETYVRRMIANAYVSLWRQAGRHESPAGDLIRLEDRDPTERIDLSDRVWRACSMLPRQQRAAVVLRYYEDRDYTEIAEVLACSEATARSHVHRALQRLETILSEEE